MASTDNGPVKPTAKITPVALLSASVGCIACVSFIAFGIAGLGGSSGAPGPTAFSWTIIMAGVLAMPLVTALLRKQVAFLRPTFAPPLAMAALVLIGATALGVLGTGGPVTTAPRQLAVPRSGKQPREQTLAEAERLSRSGQGAAATMLLVQAFDTRALRSDPELKHAMGRAKAAMAQANAPALAERLISEARDPELGKLPGSRVSPPEVWAAMDLYERYARELDESAAQNDVPEMKAARDTLRRALRSAQVRAFPKWRAAFVRDVVGPGSAMWQADVAVSASGPEKRLIQFVSREFVLNANIASAESGMRDQPVPSPVLSRELPMVGGRAGDNLRPSSPRLMTRSASGKQGRSSPQNRDAKCTI